MKKVFAPLFIPILLLASCSSISYATKGYNALDKESFSDIAFLYINWINGNINIEQGASNNFTIKETKTAYPLYYKIVDNTFYVQIAKSGTSDATIDKLNKDLDIVVPASFNLLNIASVNTDITIKGDITVKDAMNFNTVNGEINIGHYKGDNTKFECVNTTINIANLDYVTKKDLDQTSENSEIPSENASSSEEITSSEQEDVSSSLEPQSSQIDDSSSSEFIEPRIIDDHYVHMELVNCTATIGLSENIAHYIYNYGISIKIDNEYGDNDYIYYPEGVTEKSFVYRVTMNISATNANIKIRKV